MIKIPKVYEGLEPIALAYYKIDCREVIIGLVFDLHVLKFFDPQSKEYLIDCIDLGLVATGNSKEEADDQLMDLVDNHLLALIEEKNLGSLMNFKLDSESLDYYHALKRDYYNQKAKLLQEKLNHPSNFVESIVSKKVTETKLQNKIFIILKAQELQLEKAD
ncbi:MAG: hypothetical protein MUF77_08410 [Leptospira sp.]|jgi:hypothetical protein|nr:hypothetical protein [Leptospira sp.]